MKRRLLHVHETQLGSRVWCVPSGQGIARGPGQTSFPSDGSYQLVSEYICNLQRRGAVLLYLDEQRAELPEPLPVVPESEQGELNG